MTGVLREELRGELIKDNEVFALFYCDGMHSRSTFRLISICDSKDALIEVVEKKIEQGKMECDIPFRSLINSNSSLTEINSKLKYGAIQKYQLNT